ncbi:helix-turn-helix domain-containing protein [Candidatus Omnitrophota bacterium]
MRYTDCPKKPGFYHTVIEAAEKPLIEETLERTFGNQIKAAELLGINRNTLRSKIRKLGIEVNRWKH